MPWIMNGDSGTWVDEVQEPGQWVGGGGDAPAQFIPTYAPQYAGGGGDAMGTPIPLSPAFIQQQQQQQQNQTQQNISQNFGGLPTNAQGSAFNPNQSAPSQLSTNPDPTQPFNFVASPYVTAQNPFSKPINNAIQAYLGRPATQQEMLQYTTQLAKNPDSYNTLVEGIRTSTEAANAAQSGKQQLIIDPRQGDMTGGWLNASYGKYTPTSESGLSKITNAIGGAIPFAALGAMTGGAGVAAGLGSTAAGALAGGVSGAASAGINGGNVLQSALMGGVTGALGGAGSNFFNGASNVASGGLDLGSNFTWNLPATDPYLNQFVDAFSNAFSNPNELGPGTLSASRDGGSYLPKETSFSNFKSYDPVTDQWIPYSMDNPAGINPELSGTGSSSGYGNSYLSGNNTYIPQPDGTYTVLDNATGEFTAASSLPKDAVPLTNEGLSKLGPQGNPNTFELGYAPSSNTSPFSGFNPASTLGSLYNTLTNGMGTNTGSGIGPGVGPGVGPNGPGGPGTGPGGNGTGGNGTGGTGTGTGTKVPIPKIPGVSTTPTLSTLLRSPTLYQSAPGGLYKGNQNPFMFGKEQPVQNARQSYDPFAALNVPQIPLTETPNLLAQALRQG